MIKLMDLLHESYDQGWESKMDKILNDNSHWANRLVKKHETDLRKYSPKSPEILDILLYIVEGLTKKSLYDDANQVNFSLGQMSIEPNTPPSGKYDGMVLVYYIRTPMFEVFENMDDADRTQKVYSKTLSKSAALTSLLRGNNQKPIELR